MDFIKFFGFLQVGGRIGDSNNFTASILIRAESFKDIALLKLFHVPVYSFPCDAERRRNRFLRYVRIFLYEAEDVFLICSEFYCDVYSDAWRCVFRDFFIAYEPCATPSAQSARNAREDCLIGASLCARNADT